MSRSGQLVAIGCVVCFAGASTAVADSIPVTTWGRLLDDAKDNPNLAMARDELIAQARTSASLPIVKRAHSLEEVGQNRTWLDDRTAALEPEIKQQFAFAMSDFAACRLLDDELPLLAAAYRVTGEVVFRDRVLAQLEEMTAWSPLQRPGWTLFAPGNRLPKDGMDGNWLATGCGVRAIGNTLALLPGNTVPPALMAKFNSLLEAEIAGVVDDWNVKRPWFVRGNDPRTNQWVLPTEGLIRACLLLGTDKHREAYEIGVKNLLTALDAHGAHGEFEEGFGYAGFTVTSMLYTAHAMAVAGDRRAIDHPFLQHFPAWYVHHFQPAGMVVNCFDAGKSFGAAETARPLLSLLAVCTGSPAARWALTYYVGGPSNDLPGLASRALAPVKKSAAPSLFAYYERATRVNWRSNWDQSATGVWIRGGHALDGHDHSDRGHVNLVWKGHPVLIEAGTPTYGHKLLQSHFGSSIGHNVLQLGTGPAEEVKPAARRLVMPGWQKEHTVAPLIVHKLGASGGDVSVDATAGYDNLAKWNRRTVWTKSKLTVTDDVALSDGKKETLLFRWHLGTQDEATIAENPKGCVVTWPNARIVIESATPLTIAQTKLPDDTLEGHDGSENPNNAHTCLVVQSREPVAAATITTRVKPH
ncbi:MAG: heparinase II/III family protein [Candidatus Hydrogenedentes bacterium]|nr:heparinase II/III family protein [Candidatus Hydrogenedentota bacterium]